MIYYTRKRFKNRVQNKPHICLHKSTGYAIIYVVRRNAVLWADKRYHSLDYEMKARYGHKIYKIALDGGFTCPNRDGPMQEAVSSAVRAVPVILPHPGTNPSRNRLRKANSCLQGNGFSVSLRLAARNPRCLVISLIFRHLRELMHP